MQTIIITGGLGRDAELKDTKSGEILTFSVGVNQGYGERKTTNWYRCSVWGKRATTLSAFLLKGTKVAVSGELEIGEYEGKAQFNINVSNVDIMSKGEQAAKPAPRATKYDDLEDDSIPF